MQNPQKHHWKAVKCILRYLVGTTTHDLLIRRISSTNIHAFSDAYRGSDVDDHKSTTGYCVYLGFNIITWSSHKQKVVSRSRVSEHSCCPHFWLHSLLRELHISTGQPQLFSDNLGAILLSANLVMHSRTKHFELDLHFVRDYVQKQFVKLIHLPTRFQVTNAFTKPVSRPSFYSFRSKHMVIDKP